MFGNYIVTYLVYWFAVENPTHDRYSFSIHSTSIVDKATMFSI